MIHSNKKIVLFILSFSIYNTNAATEYQATLESHFIIPANTFIAPPKDITDNLKYSGKYTELNKRLSPQKNKKSLELPFKDQPIQGFSGIKFMPDKSIWVITDNGAGSKNNSYDFMLYLNQYQLDPSHQKIKHIKTIFLHDPDKNIPFHIVNESTKKRYLTGADFDPESFQWTKNHLWIGEEFGPYLIKADKKGKILQVFPTLLDNKIIYSPDSPYIKTPDTPNTVFSADIRRSKGFEGLALSPDKKKLYALLEGPIFDPNKKKWEQYNDKTVLRILEFDLEKEKWTGRYWFYPLEKEDNAIGDFNLIDLKSGLIIERDNFEGTKKYLCKINERENCYQNIASFKRIYKIQLDNNNVYQNIHKVSYIDLLAIADPKKRSKVTLNEKGLFDFPFFTIENVDIIDDQHIIVGNDNNLPFSHGRKPDKVENNELIILNVGHFLTD